MNYTLIKIIELYKLIQLGYSMVLLLCKLKVVEQFIGRKCDE